MVACYAFHFCEVSVNGTPIGEAAHWEQTSRLDATDLMHPGSNVITLVVSNTDPHLPAAIGRVVLQFETGDDLVVPLDDTWKATQNPPTGWEQPGFDDTSWPAAAMIDSPWYGPPLVSDLARVPAPFLRKEFSINNGNSQEIKRATVYVTALGTYELHLNGQRVGNDVLAPGWTEFRKRVHYQTYDVTSQVTSGSNAIGAVLGDGWYASDLAFIGRRNLYGGPPRFLAQLVIELADGTTQVIGTDESWKATYGPILHADLLLGCEYDTRLEMAGWDKTGFPDESWKPVVLGAGVHQEIDVTNVVKAAEQNNRVNLQVENDLFGDDPAFNQIKSLRVVYQHDGIEETKTVGEHETLDLAGENLVILSAHYGKRSTLEEDLRVEASVAEPARVIQELSAKSISQPDANRWIFDLGQNMVGWTRLKIRGGQPGQRLTIRHSEMLNDDGTIYTAALRSCPATDYFILSGKDEEILEPKFTFHGFRYVEIRGLTSEPPLDTVTGIVVHTPMRRTGQFECSYPMLNQLYSNILWGQKGNYLEVPTDCPQRDERMGWTGDTQFFAPTAAYNFDVANFFTRWLQTCEDDQFPDGRFPHVVPDLMGEGGSTAWGDAALICTYNLYHAYGDTRVVADRFDSLERYMKWLNGRTNNGISDVGGYGDWLNAGGGAKKEVIDTAYHAYLARIMSEMAAAIGRVDESEHYKQLHETVKAAFAKEFVQPDGSLVESSQTGYALAFSMDLLPTEMKQKAADQFVNEIKRFDWHLATGFIGTPRLLPALSAAGRDDVAYRLLFNDTYPSWLFPVKNGATTMWERWNGWTPEDGFGNVGMNSFNHYAFGAVGEYLYGGVGGIQATSPGYKTFQVSPAVGQGLTWANTEFDSIYGRITSNWKHENGRLTMDVTIPTNTSATVRVPTSDASLVTESGTPVSQADGVKLLRTERNAAVYRVGSGTYQFQSTLPKASSPGN